MEDRKLKFTEFDNLTDRRQFQMMKAALPYIGPMEQRVLSVFTKIGELQNTLSLFRKSSDTPLSTCSLEEQPAKTMDMLKAIKPFASPNEQQIIDTISSVLQVSTPEEPVSAMNTAAPDSTDHKKNMIPEQLKPLMPPEMQSKMETMQLLMQIMQT